MTETQVDRLSWVRDDDALVDRLNTERPNWHDPGSDDSLVTLLDQEETWRGWDDWSEDDKRTQLHALLDRAWVAKGSALADRLDSVWPRWVDADENGLAAFLDQQEDWAGWRTWSEDDKRSFLAQSLDVWYGAPDQENADQEHADLVRADQAHDRHAWARSDDALRERLNTLWDGWDKPGPDGLAAHLDGQQDWADWESWSDEDKRWFLGQSLDKWYAAETPEASEVGVGGPEAKTGREPEVDAEQPTEGATEVDVVALVQDGLIEALMDEEIKAAAAALTPEEVLEIVREVFGEATAAS